MTIEWDNDSVLFGNLDEFLVVLLRRLPAAAAIDHEAAQKRLFGAPTGGKDPEADEEWKEMIEPDLREYFETQVGVVVKDLERIEGPDPEEEEFQLRVPSEHLPSWVHTLNQARIALAAKHDITEEDMEGAGIFETEEKGFAFLQVELYGRFLQFLLFHTDI